MRRTLHDLVCRRSRRLRGFTLTELAAVVGIFGLIMSAVWVAAYQTKLTHKTEQAMQQTMAIVSAYRSFYAQTGIDSSITNGYGNFLDVTCIGVNAGFFPSTMLAASATCPNASTFPQSPWAQPVNVATNKQNNTILIIYNNLPQAACVRLASAVFGAPDVTYQAIGGSGGWPWTDQYLPPYGAGTSYTINQITAACSGTSSYDVQVGFKAR